MLKDKNELQARISYIEKFGYEKAAEKFGVKVRTLRRNMRHSKKRDDVEVKDYKEPKILLFDLETAYMEANRIWSCGKNYIDHKQITKKWSILSWSAKWLFDSKIMSEKVSGRQAKKREDKNIVKSLWKLIDESDVIIAHNLRSFDKKKFNTRALLNGLNPPSPYRMIDPLRQARKEFKFASNSLEYLGGILSESKDKLHTDYTLWDKICQDGDEEALDYMVEYNEMDVLVLEDVYLKLRPWIKSHPNLGLYYNDIGKRCSVCGSKDIEATDNHYYTSTGKYKVMKCNYCGTPTAGRSRFADLTTEERADLLAPIAR